MPLPYGCTLKGAGIIPALLLPSSHFFASWIPLPLLTLLPFLSSASTFLIPSPNLVTTPNLIHNYSIAKNAQECIVVIGADRFRLLSVLSYGHSG